MSESNVEVKSWEQQTLFPQGVIEVQCRVGIVTETDHVQVQVEAIDPSTNKVVMMWSCPHAPTKDLRRVLDHAWIELENSCGLSPF